MAKADKNVKAIASENGAAVADKKKVKKVRLLLVAWDIPCVHAATLRTEVFLCWSWASRHSGR